MMRNISGEGFISDESIDQIIDRFGDMIVEMKRIRLAENLDYAMGLCNTIAIFRKIGEKWKS